MTEMTLRATIRFDLESGIDLPDESLDYISVENPYNSKIEDSTYLVEEVVRVLKKGGRASFEIYNVEEKTYLTTMLDAVMKLESTEEIEGSSAMMMVTLEKCEVLEKATKYTDKSWDGSKSRFSLEELARAVPTAVARWARSQGDLKKENLKLPYKEPDGTINLNGVRAALAAIGGSRGNKPDLPANVLNEARRQLERVLAAGNKAMGKSSMSKSDEIRQTSAHPFDYSGDEITNLYKADEERIVYYPVLEPYRLDADGHYFPPEVIFEACEEVKKSGVMININHDKSALDQAGDVAMIDCFIAKGDEEFINYAGETVRPKAGGWYIGLFVKSDEIWAGVKDGRYSAVSVGGTGSFVEGNVREVVFQHAA